MKNTKQKFTSRKFIVCVSGILVGIGIIVAGNVIEGSATVVAAIVAYLAAEGYIDAKAVGNTAQSIADKLTKEEET